MSNEYSANEPNIHLGGIEINHQFGKSFDLESAYHDFVKRELSNRLEYFSLLRPLYELKIVEIFSHYPQYLGQFVSCNFGVSRNQWCMKCEKCAFILLALAAFCDDSALEKVFGQHALQQTQLRKHFLTLTTAKTKPWECVGVQKECKLALAMLLERRPTLQFANKPHRSDLVEACADIDIEQSKMEYLSSFNTPHLLPKQFIQQIKAHC